MRYKNDYLKLDQNLILEICGRRGEIRTPDILLPKQARYQATLHAEGQKYSVNRAFGQFLYVKMVLYFKLKFELQA
jgi:CHAD domain-containing protein